MFSRLYILSLIVMSLIILTPFWDALDRGAAIRVTAVVLGASFILAFLGRLTRTNPVLGIAWSATVLVPLALITASFVTADPYLSLLMAWSSQITTPALAGTLLAGAAGVVLAKRREHLPEKWRNFVTGRLVRGCGWLVAIALIGVIGIIDFAAFQNVFDWPGMGKVQTVHATHLVIDPLKPVQVLADAGHHLSGHAVVMSGRNGDVFSLTRENVLLASGTGNVAKAFENPLTDVSDMLVIRGESDEMVLVVQGKALVRADSQNRLIKVAELPFAGMRFGQRVHGYGTASEFILYGNHGNKGMVYGFKPNGEYLKIAETDSPVTAATGLFGSTIVATDGKIILLTPGENPAMLFRVPAGYGPVLSILADVPKHGGPQDAVLLIAVADAVFCVQNGTAYVLLEGLGGELRALPKENPQTSYGAVLTDGKRHTAVRMQIMSGGVSP